MKLSNLIGASAVAFGLMLSATPAAADFIPCMKTGDGAYDISKYVSTANDCDILSPLDGKANDSQTTVNTAAFFGFNNWAIDGKYDGLGTSGTDGSSLFNFTGGNLSGTYTPDGDFTDITQVMFIFKDGQGTNLVGYLLSDASDFESGGTYRSPFTEPPFDFEGTGADRISHISVYYRMGNGWIPPQEIPEPLSLALVGLGLTGIGIARRRRNI